MNKDYKPSWIKISLLALALIAVMAGGFFLVKKKLIKSTPTKIYEALVAVTDQKASDPAEDLRSSLKTGDVITILPEGHQWSDTEKTSYLILKLKLTEDQAQKLAQPETKKIDPEKAGLSAGQSPALDAKEREPRQETVRARQYRLKIETLGFDVQKFWQEQKQPYPDKIFDWKLTEKKR